MQLSSCPFVACVIVALVGCGDDDGPVGMCTGALCPDGGAVCTGPAMPALICGDVTAACTGPRTAVTVPEPSLDERCGMLAGEPMSDAPAEGFAVGDTAVTFTAGAAAGGAVTCATTVTVTDATPPAITCSTATVVRTGPDEVVAPPAATATDACDDAVDIVAAPLELVRGTTPVTWTGTDDGGQMGTCTADITVLEAFAPEGFRIVSARIATDGSTDVTVAWDGAGGEDLTGYAIERADDLDGPWTRLMTLGTGARTWTDDTLASEHAFYRAVALAGDFDGGTTEPLPAFAIDSAGYDLRGRSVTMVPFATTLYGVVRHPRDLEAGPYPLVLMLHGNHGNCRRSPTDPNDTCGDSEDHECPFAGWVTTPNAEGMAYLAETIAAQGYVVASLSGNALNCRDDYILERAHLIVAHLSRWLAWATIGGDPFGSTFAGAVDMRRVALVGHSRGGEAVAHVPEVLRGAPMSGVSIASVFSIAPTDYHDPTVVDAPYAVLLPTCDGDVETLEGMHIYDRSLSPGDSRVQAQVVFSRANHNYFNTEWRLDDNGDGRQCPTSVEIGAPAQRGMLEAVLGSWLRGTIGGAGYEPFLRGEGGVPEGIDAWADTALDLRFSYSAATRSPIDDFADADLGTNSLGHPNTFTADFYVARQCFENDCDTRFDHQKNALFLSWDGTGMPRASIALADLDAAPHGYISFRMTSRRSLFNDGREVQDFWLRVADASGTETRLLLSDVQPVPHLYPANRPLELLQTVRIPVELLAEAGLDPTSLATLDVEVPAPDRTTGSFLLTDLELAAE